MPITESDIYFGKNIPNDIQDAYIEILEAWCYTNLKDQNVRSIFIKDYAIFPYTMLFETFFNGNHKKPDTPCDIFIKLPLIFKVQY